MLTKIHRLFQVIFRIPTSWLGAITLLVAAVTIAFIATQVTKERSIIQHTFALKFLQRHLQDIGAQASPHDWLADYPVELRDLVADGHLTAGDLEKLSSGGDPKIRYLRPIRNAGKSSVLLEAEAPKLQAYFVCPIEGDVQVLR